MFKNLFGTFGADAFAADGAEHRALAEPAAESRRAAHETQPLLLNEFELLARQRCRLELRVGDRQTHAHYLTHCQLEHLPLLYTRMM